MTLKYIEVGLQLLVNSELDQGEIAARFSAVLDRQLIGEDNVLKGQIVYINLKQFKFLENRLICKHKTRDIRIIVLEKTIEYIKFFVLEHDDFSQRFKCDVLSVPSFNALFVVDNNQNLS